MTLVIKNDSKSAKNKLKAQENFQNFQKKIQLKKLDCPVMITQKAKKFMACPVKAVQICRPGFIKLTFKTD